MVVGLQPGTQKLKSPLEISRPAISLVVPCFNEEEVLTETVGRLREILDRLIDAGSISPSSHIVLVDDGSWDDTPNLISRFAAEHADGSLPRVGGIRLSRNRGHQNALLAGLMSATGDAIISVDADLQDDLEVIPSMIEAFGDGADIVYGVRTSRHRDTFFKRLTAESYYRLLKSLGVLVVFNHADYRLMSRRAIEALREYREVNLYLRSIIPLLGFTTRKLDYERAERFAGDSKYPLRKMVALAVEGVTSFSVTPLRLITGAGAVLALVAFALGAWALYVKLFGDSRVVEGWASIVLPMLFLGGVQLLSMGIIGEYIGKTYMEVKQRPRYHVDGFLGEASQFLSHEARSRPEGFMGGDD
jgi:glycosyltransferase involved in cell wall biosynthesis